MIKFFKTHFKILIGVILLFLWLMLTTYTVFLGSNESFSILSTAYGKNNFININTGNLLKGDKIAATFTSQENNLGLVSVRFNTFNRINKDIVTFEIKQVGDKNWYYKYNYKVDQFQPGQLFTFGFPVIKNSYNKSYYFEIISNNGTKGSSIALDSTFPTFVAEYQYSKQEIFESHDKIKGYLIKKIINSFQKRDVQVISLTYLLPFVLYMMGIVSFNRGVFKHIPISLEFNNNYLKKWANFYQIFGVYLSIIILGSLVLTLVPLLVQIIVIMSWIGVVKYKDLSSKSTFILVLLLLFPVPFAVLLNNITFAQNLANWVYFFLLFGIIQESFVLRKTLTDI